jgi:CheY-like chemotaxis protein
VARLLVVDDDHTQVELRKMLLETAGHEVWVATSAGEALRLLTEQSPDLLLMDLGLPAIRDGLQLIRGARLLPSRVKIIVVSGWPLELFERPEQKMVDNVLTKPVRFHDLLEAVREALSA